MNIFCYEHEKRADNLSALFFFLVYFYFRYAVYRFHLVAVCVFLVPLQAVNTGVTSFFDLVEWNVAVFFNLPNLAIPNVVDEMLLAFPDSCFLVFANGYRFA